MAEVLLQRTRADQVVPVYEQFAAKYSEPALLAREKPEEFDRVVRPLGLHWRAPLMLQMARQLEVTSGPADDMEELLALPGVGPYAAAAFLSMHRNVRAPIVDANVVRLLGRLLGFPFDGETRRKRWLIELVELLTPRREFRDYNFAILDLSMTICRSRPACADCPIRSFPCRFATSATPTTPPRRRRIAP